jgi:excisionase family DNA binding protein
MASDYEILTVKEICELLKFHPTTVYKLLRQGEIPSFRIGTDWRFRKDLILRWLKTETVPIPLKAEEAIESGVNGDGRRPAMARGAKPREALHRWLC